jgi:hypothetical protein
MMEVKYPTTVTREVVPRLPNVAREPGRKRAWAMVPPRATPRPILTAKAAVKRVTMCIRIYLFAIAHLELRPAITVYQATMQKVLVLVQAEVITIYAFEFLPFS